MKRCFQEAPLTQELGSRSSKVNLGDFPSQVDFGEQFFTHVRGLLVEFGCPRGDASFALSFSLGLNPKFLTHTRVVQTHDCPFRHWLWFGIHSIYSLGLYTGESGGFVPILPWQTLGKGDNTLRGFPLFRQGILAPRRVIGGSSW